MAAEEASAGRRSHQRPENAFCILRNPKNTVNSQLLEYPIDARATTKGDCRLSQAQRRLRPLYCDAWYGTVTVTALRHRCQLSQLPDLGETVAREA